MGTCAIIFTVDVSQMLGTQQYQTSDVFLTVVGIVTLSQNQHYDLIPMTCAKILVQETSPTNMI